jgi:hypothetical protein
MKKIVVLLILFSSLSLNAFTADMRSGSLNVSSTIQGANIYVDGKLIGENQIKIGDILAGTHFLKITTGLRSTEATLYAEVVEIKAGETTMLYVSEKGVEQHNAAVVPVANVDVFKTKRILDYGREMHTGWYLKLESIFDRYSNLEDNAHSNYLSSTGLGLGYKIALVQNMDFTLEMDRGQYSAHPGWYFMPITANISFNFLPSPYIRGKQYYGLGLGYYMTDLETPNKENLTAMGYHLFYGIELPVGDKNAVFLQLDYHRADISRYDYLMEAYYVSVGYRWDIME